MPLNFGARLARYDLTALLGEGGMGQGWQATGTQLQRAVTTPLRRMNVPT